MCKTVYHVIRALVIDYSDLERKSSENFFFDNCKQSAVLPYF